MSGGAYYMLAMMWVLIAHIHDQPELVLGCFVLAGAGVIAAAIRDE